MLAWMQDRQSRNPATGMIPLPPPHLYAGPSADLLCSYQPPPREVRYPERFDKETFQGIDTLALPSSPCFA
jgi:hypothetical protein